MGKKQNKIKWTGKPTEFYLSTESFKGFAQQSRCMEHERDGDRSRDSVSDAPAQNSGQENNGGRTGWRQFGGWEVAGFWTHVLNANIYAKGDGKRNVLNQIRHRVRKQETKVRDDSKVFESDQSELKTLRKEIL